MPSKWNPEPAPFGNARGLDYVALDVKAQIVHRMGGTVLAGHLPADIEAEQPERLEANKRAYGDRFTTGGEPFAAFTISHDGLTLSGEHADGNGHTSGYRSHYWADRIGPDTIVFDLRTVPDDMIVALAVRGPMLDVKLPAGTVSRLDGNILADPVAATITENYLGAVGGTEALGY